MESGNTKGEEMTTLHVFANTVTEWIVAVDPADAVKVWEETVGEGYDHEYGEFEQVADDKELTIHDEDESYGVPTGGVLVAPPSTYRATMRAWADLCGRGYLCSTEY